MKPLALIVGHSPEKYCDCGQKGAILTVRMRQQNRLYFILQIFGWSAYIVVSTVFAAFFKEFNVVYFFLSLNVGITGFVLTHIYRSRFGDDVLKDRSLVTLAQRVLIGAGLISLIWTMWTLPSNFLLLYAYNLVEEELTIGYGFAIWINLFILTLLWLLIYDGVKLVRNLRQSEVEKWKLQAAIKDAELIALKSQINPHFIFNCLNNIRSLVIEDPEKSRDMITHLSDLLRYSIQFNNEEKVTIEHELEVIKDYLELESIQFEDRLSYRLEIEDDLMDFKIPPMTLQMLVENAIKHGISDLPEGGEIVIRAYKKENKIFLQVENTGQLAPVNGQAGIGLKNVRERMHLIFEHAKFELSNIDENNVRAEFEVAI
jgi:signal transduction histidine kinase